MFKILVAALLALAITAGPPASQSVTPGLPTARMCVLRDLGAPDPVKKSLTLDPIWQVAIGRVTVGPDSDLYSTAPSGGFYGYGEAFKVTRKGELTVLYAFHGGKDGAGPKSGLILGHDNSYWGTTYGGGKFGAGTIFRLPGRPDSPDVRIHFRNGSTTGLVPPDCPKRPYCPFSPRQRADAAPSYPIAPPVPDGHGNYYGVTPYSNNQQFGALYRLSPPYDSTGFKTLCIFDPPMLADKDMAQFVCSPNGRMPGSLILSNDGSVLYGTLTGDAGHLYQATLEGRVTLLHLFSPTTGTPPLNILQASNGKIYGTSYGGGEIGGGTVWQFDPAAKVFRTMTSFRYLTFIAGLNPMAGLVEGRSKTPGASDGWLYGVTRFGGRNGRGAFYRIPLEGDSYGLQVLQDLDQASTGRSSLTTPVLHGDGNFYGITSEGGTYGGGVLYRLGEVNLHPRTTSPMQSTAGNIPLEADGKTPVTDDLVEVRTNVQMWQVEWRPDNPFIDAISLLVRCRNPHFVQFVYRERLDDQGRHVPGQFGPTSGSYKFTMDPNSPVWHTDALSKPDAYFENGKGASWWSYTSGQTTALKIADMPGFGTPDYPADHQGLPFNETWRFTARTFAICNCAVKREIWWTVEYKDSKRTYKDVKILPADNSAYDFINQHTVPDGFHPVP